MPISDLPALEFIGHTCITLAHIHINKNKNLKKKTSQDILLIVIVRAMCIIRNTDREKNRKKYR